MKEIFQKCDVCKGLGHVPYQEDNNFSTGGSPTSHQGCPKCEGKRYIGTGFYIEGDDQQFPTVDVTDIKFLKKV